MKTEAAEWKDKKGANGEALSGRPGCEELLAAEVALNGTPKGSSP